MLLGAEGELVVRSSFQRHPPASQRQGREHSAMLPRHQQGARATRVEAGSSADSGLLKFVFVFRASRFTLPHTPFRPVSLRIYVVGDVVCVCVCF